MTTQRATVLIVGADGMIGFGLWTYFRNLSDRNVVGSVRSARDLAAFGGAARDGVIVTGCIADDATLDGLLAKTKPSLVINCAGATMHAAEGGERLIALPANSLLPHRLHALARKHGARFLHLSTDCVFEGTRGGYRETDPTDAISFYGMSKALGEVVDADDAVTIRTSPIGYELSSQRGLLGWFLHQRGTIKGFTNAYFSGLTNLHLAQMIDRYFVDPDQSGRYLSGVYHVTGPKISKFDLLVKCRDVFANPVEIVPNGDLVLDRSLDCAKLAAVSGYSPPSWDSMLGDLASFAKLYPAGTITRGG